MADQDDFGDCGVGKAGFDVVNRDADVPCAVSKTSLDQALADIGDEPVADWD